MLMLLVIGATGKRVAQIVQLNSRVDAAKAIKLWEFVLLMFQLRLPFLPAVVSSNLTFKGFPQYKLPSSAAIAALAS